jgi:hypothetical protein
MDPELIQTVKRDETGTFTKGPIYTQVLGACTGEGLLTGRRREVALAKTARGADLPRRGSGVLPSDFRR